MAPLTQYQSGQWRSGVEHLGALLLVNAKESGTPASLEWQLRASTPRAPEEVALIPNQQSLAADPPTQKPLDGGGSRARYVSQAGSGKGYNSVQVMGRADARRGRVAGTEGLPLHRSMVSLPMLNSSICRQASRNCSCSKASSACSSQAGSGESREDGDRAW